MMPSIMRRKDVQCNCEELASTMNGSKSVRSKAVSIEGRFDRNQKSV